MSREQFYIERAVLLLLLLLQQLLLMLPGAAAFAVAVAESCVLRRFIVPH